MIIKKNIKKFKKLVKYKKKIKNNNFQILNKIINILKFSCKNVLSFVT